MNNLNSMVVFAMFSSALVAQQQPQTAGQWYHSLVHEELRNERDASIALASASENLSRSMRALEKTAPLPTRELLDWKAMTADEARFESNMRAVGVSLGIAISGDEDIAKLVIPSPETDAVLRSMFQGLTARANNLKNYSDAAILLKAMMTSMQREFDALPPQDSPDYRQLADDLRAMRTALDTNAQYWHDQSAQYAVTLSQPDVRVFFKVQAPLTTEASAPPQAPPAAVQYAEPTRGQRVANAIGDIATRVYLAHYCPQVRSVPVAFMNANQAQLLQACMAWGY